MNSAITTFYSWNSTVNVGLIFKKVEMTPYFLNSIMDGTIYITTFGAREFRSLFKINPDIKLLQFRIKNGIFNVPRIFNIQSLLKELFVNGKSNSCNYISEIDDYYHYI
jgi:hypothetical protein